MKILKPMSEQVRNKIKTFKKNRIDISDIIKDYSIKGEDLSGAIITEFTRVGEDCTGVNLARCTIGKPKGTVDISGCNITNANLHRARFLGRVKACSIIARNANFNRCYFPAADYRNADFRGATFCDSIFRLGGSTGKNAKFDKETIDSLFKDFLIN